MIADTARGFFEERVPSEAVRSAMESDAGYDRSLWSAVMSEMGFGGIAIPEADGGAGLGHVELALVMMEMGRRLYPSPFLSSACLSATAIRLAGSEAQRAALLPGIIDGTTVATLAPGLPELKARLDREAGSVRLSGEARFVPFGHAAALLVVAAQSDDGIALVALPAATAGISVERHVTMDMTRPLATLRFDAVAVADDQILGNGDSSAALARTLDLGRIALAAEQAGGAEAALDHTVAYSMERVQFGRPIGSFQALKHRMADMMIAVEAAKTAALYAACVADEREEELAEAAAVAKATCSDAFFKCAGDMIQLHGGIGITWEHDAHLFFKRARSSATMLGDAVAQRETVARLIGLDEEA